MLLSITEFDVPLREHTYVRNLADEKNTEEKKTLVTNRDTLNYSQEYNKSRHYADTFDVPTCVKVVLCRRRAGVGQLAVVGV